MEYRGYLIEGDNTFGMKVIKNKGSGQLPTLLKGSYTKAVMAQQDIDIYLLRKEEEENKPAAIKKVKLTPRGEEVNDEDSGSRDH